MNWPQSPEQWWQLFLLGLRFLARIPLAILAITCAGCLGFMLFMVLFRITQWTWRHWFSMPWGAKG